MKTYIATRDLPLTSIKKGDAVAVGFSNDGTFWVYEMDMAIMLATGLIEEVPEKKEWRAEDLDYGDTYWTHDSRIFVFETVWSGTGTDIYRRATGNCFETQELAQAAYDKLMYE